MRRSTLMLALCSTPLALRVGSAARSGRGIVRMNANLPTTADVTDVREWLEEVEGEDALAWVKEQNADAISTFGEPSAQPLYSRILASLESDESDACESPRSSKSPTAQTSTGDSRGGVGWTVALRGVPSSDDDSSESTSSGAKDWYGSAV